MLPQFMNWGAITDNIGKVVLDTKAQTDLENRKRWVLIAVGAVGAALFVLLIAKGR